jgi:hypothetical protein
MAFADDIARIPFTPRGTDAAGFLAPMFATIGHLMLVLEATAEETITLPDEELRGELEHASLHWNAINAGEALSTPAAGTIADFGAALQSANTEFDDWDEATRLRNIRDLANRSRALATILDRELVGLRDSDPGYTL